MNFDDLHAAELELFLRCARKWARKWPVFGKCVAAATSDEIARRKGLDIPKAPIQLPALSREEIFNLVFSLMWTAKNLNLAQIDHIETLVLGIARDMIDLTLQREAALVGNAGMAR